MIQTGVITDIAKLYNLMLVQMTLTLIHGHRDAKKNKLLQQLSSKCLIHWDGIWSIVETCWSNEAHTHFITSHQYSKERTLLR